MNENDIKQMIVDVMGENGQTQGRDKPRYSNPQRQRQGSMRRNNDNFSKLIIIFQSLLMLGTSIFVKYMEIVYEVDVSDLKVPMVALYGSSIGFFQLRKGLEHMNMKKNTQHVKSEDERGEHEDFD